MGMDLKNNSNILSGRYTRFSFSWLWIVQQFEEVQVAAPNGHI